MELEEAKKLLDLCEREELRDHAFGDREVFWTFDGVEVAGGYFGSVDQNVWLLDMEAGTEIAGFRKDDAYELVKCGRLKAVERNDMQGNDIPNYRGA